MAATLKSLRISFNLALKAENKSPRTIENYLAGLDQFAAWAPDGPDTGAEDVSTDDIRRWVMYLQESGRSPATVNTRFRALRAFFNWAELEGEVEPNPMARLKQPKVPDKPVEVVNDADMAALLATCEGRSKKSFLDRRDAAVLRVLVDTGIRRGELVGLMVTDVDLTEREITVTGKGGRTRTIRFGLKTAQALDRYLRVRGTKDRADINPALWLSDRGGTTWTKSGPRLMLGRRAAEAGLGYVPYPHQFRHTFADDYLRSGGGEGDLMRTTGWRSRQMVDRYGASVAESRARDSRDRLQLKGDRL